MFFRYTLSPLEAGGEEKRNKERSYLNNKLLTTKLFIMNRKYSTLLTMGLLLASSLNVYADKLADYKGAAATEVKAGTKYFLVQNDGTADLALGFTGYNIDTKMVTADGLYLSSDILSGDDYKKYVWTVTENESLGKVTFTLTNAYYNLVLYVQDNGSDILTNYGALTATAPYHSELAWTTGMNQKYKAAKAAGSTYLIPGRANDAGWASTAMGIAFNPTPGSPNVNIGLATTDPKTAVTLYEVTDAAVSDTELNELYNTNGFNFDLTTAGVDNIFADQKVKAIKVRATDAVSGTDVAGDPKMGFPAGTYFAVSTPDLDYNDPATNKYDYLLNCTFIAVSPTDNATSDADYRKNGKGFKMTTVSGKDLNLFISTTASVIAADGAKMTSGDEVSVYNAAFNVVKNFDGDKYALSLPNMRFQKATGAATHDQKSVKVAVMSDLNYVSGKTLATDTPSANQFIFKFAEPVIVKASELLSQDGASIFNIQFVGGAADGAYLTDFSGAYYTQGEVLADLEAPAYQYIVTNVNGTNVTFRNRQTGTQFIAKLYKEDDGCYSLNMTATPASVLDLDENNDVKAAATLQLNGAHIQLVPATSTDKFNGYWNVDNESLVTLAFARDFTPTSNKLYPQYNPTTGLLTKEMTDNVIEATQWQLLKDEKPTYQTVSYAYLDANDKVVYKTKGDTVAVYQYELEYIADGNPTGLKLGAVTGGYDLATPAGKFYIKQNVDGSVSLQTTINATADLEATLNVGATSDADRRIRMTAKTMTPFATTVKTYLIQDAPEISLPIETTFATMQSEMGNYISMNEEQDGLLINLDPSTVKVFATDSAKAIPSFYVSIGKNEDGSRAYMFNPVDSVNYYVGAGAYDKKYQWDEGVRKVIFKDAILNETADTLTTSIKGKVANVAAKADRKGTQAGLDKFKFQIVKADPEEDAYIIRQNGAYVASLNGKLWIGAPRNFAVLFNIENTTAPTANEAIAAEPGVQVIGGQGVVTVQGAAGKVVTVANILGQTIANQVAASDNVTIAVPAGIVVVAVDGEATKVVVK